MAKTYDAIIIGAGVIGAAVGFELAKLGRRTLNVDALPASGYGSTSNSCAIIRVHYSTLDGTAMAYDGYFYWRDWADYLECADERGLAEFHETGCLVMKTAQNDRLERVLTHVEALDIPHQHWDAARIKEAMPIYDLSCFGPAKRIDEDGFGEATGGAVDGGVFFPTAGYISDPQLSTHNIQRAAEAKGAEFLFNAKVAEIPVQAGRVGGVVLADGTAVEAPVVVNVAGPHSYKVNALAGAAADMKITTRALRQEVAHLPAPDGFDYGGRGFVVSDSDIAVYTRPEIGSHILAGS